MVKHVHYYQMINNEGCIEYNANLIKEFYECMSDVRHKIVARDLGTVTIIELYLMETNEVTGREMYILYGYSVVIE